MLSKPLSPCLNHPKTRTRQLEQAAPKPQNLMKLFKLVNSKSAYPVLLYLSRGNHSKVSCAVSPDFSASQPALALPCVPLVEWHASFSRFL